MAVFIRFAVFACFTVLSVMSGAAEERRVALVIGNALYPGASVLANPEHDADAMTAAFKAAGFDEVIERKNLNRLDMLQALGELQDKSKDADYAILYYSGHGIEIDGKSYLLPIDARMALDKLVQFEAISLDQALQFFSDKPKLRMILFDACRENPTADKMAWSSSGAKGGLTRGLGRQELKSASNTLIAYASAPGQIAFDGANGDSPFAVALIHHMFEPGVDVRLALGDVKDEVFNLTKDMAEQTNRDPQTPYQTGSVGSGRFILSKLAPTSPIAPDSKTSSNPNVPPPIDRHKLELDQFEAAKASGSIEALNTFLLSAEDASLRIAALDLRQALERKTIPNRPIRPACPLKLAASDAGGAGQIRFNLTDPCGQTQNILVTYDNTTYSFTGRSAGDVDFMFDFYAGAKPLVIKSTDGRDTLYQPSVFSQQGIAKVVLSWDGPYRLELHALEDSASPGSSRDINTANPRSVADLNAASGGMLVAPDHNPGLGTHVQVYTLRVPTIVRSVDFKVNFESCDNAIDDLRGRIAIYKNGFLERSAQVLMKARICGSKYASVQSLSLQTPF